MINDRINTLEAGVGHLIRFYPYIFYYEQKGDFNLLIKIMN